MAYTAFTHTWETRTSKSDIRYYEFAFKSETQHRHSLNETK